MLVCQYCHVVVYWDDETVLKMGTTSILPEKDTRLFMGARGTVGERGFHVIGHLRYAHASGVWDEWYVEDRDGQPFWLSEDERELTLERVLDSTSDAVTDAIPTNGDQVSLGQTMRIEGVDYSVREINRAECVGGEGQLPFVILPGETYPFVDIASIDGTRFGTLEFDHDERPTVFLGESLSHEALTIEDEHPPSTEGSREGKQIRCANCHAPHELSAERDVKMLVCAYCGAQLDLTQAHTKVLGVSSKDAASVFVLSIGQKGTFDGVIYEICGRMLYSDEEGYETREYLLYHPDRGYVWLYEEQGHYVLARPTNEAPHRRDVFYGTPKEKMRVGSSTFQFYESGKVSLKYVDGALPWICQQGDSFRYTDLIAPPRIFSVEQEGSEVECFVGRYVPYEEVQRAFNEKGPRKHFAVGVHPAQPFVQHPSWIGVMYVGLIFAVLNLLLMAWASVKPERVVFASTFSAEEYTKETTSQPFVVGDEPVIAFSSRAPLNNSWIAVDVAFVDSADRVVMELENDISYYEGVEGGESWSEGSRSQTRYYRAPPAGSYRMILRASRGTGESADTRSLNSGESLRVEVRQGAVLTRYFLAVFVVAGMLAGFVILRRRLFEVRRWAPVMPDSDDDEDD